MIDFLDRRMVVSHDKIEPRIEPLQRQDNAPNRRPRTLHTLGIATGILTRRVLRIGESETDSLCAQSSRLCASRTTSTNDIKNTRITHHNGCRSHRLPASAILALGPLRLPLGNLLHDTIHSQIPPIAINRHSRRHHQPSRASGRYLGVSPAGGTEEQGFPLQEEIKADGGKGSKRCKPSVQVPRLRRGQEDA